MLKKIVSLVFVSAAVATLAASTPAGADEPADWVLENCVDAAGKPTTKLESGAKCDIKSPKRGQCLVFDKHMGQVDWDFAACGSKPRNALLVARNSGALNCGETFALKLGSEYFRKCHDPQTVGINICSDSGSKPESKHFEWQLRGCSGQAEAGKSVALYNVTRGDSVVYAKRPSRMVDTCWADKMKMGQCTTVRDK